MKKQVISTLCGLCILAPSAAFAQAAPQTEGAGKSVPVITPQDKERAAIIVANMTLEEKCLLVTGQIDGFHSAAIERLGIPSVRMADGPQGVRNNTHSTYYPCGILLAASFNRDAAKGVGTGIGYDAKARGVGIMLCPGVNIYRSALCGRNFEYYGEDPYLASQTAISYITGMQEQGVMSTVKHFAANSQEYDRHGVSSSVDERTLNEIYFPVFRAAVEKARVAAVMTSYNPLNGVHAAENSWLIRDNLRAWGHEGIVMSDWTSTYTTLGTLESGLDLEMPKGYVLNYKDVKQLLDNGVSSEDFLDEKCRHILQTYIAYGFLDNPMQDTSIPEDYDVSRNLAYRATVEGIVLLKNEGILPLKPGKVVVLGPNADQVAFGGGSGRMDPIEGRAITLYAGMKNLGPKWNVNLMDWKNIDKTTLAKAQAVIFAGGFSSKTEKEDRDRTYTLPDGQNEAIKAIAAINPNLIVVANSGGEFDIIPWKDDAKAIVMAWYSGQEGGTALADIISGKVSPSGRLPFTFWGTLDNNPAQQNYGLKKGEAKYDGKNPRREQRFDRLPFTQYTEGVFLGYRGVDKFFTTPLYPFGYGLTYSSFEYSGLKATTLQANALNAATKDPSMVELSFTLKNTGKVEASEAAQVYVAPVASAIERPVRELKEFAKVRLAKGKSTTVKMELPASAFSYYDIKSHSWVVDPGDYKIQVGASSQDIRLETIVTIKK